MRCHIDAIEYKSRNRTVHAIPRAAKSQRSANMQSCPEKTGEPRGGENSQGLVARESNHQRRAGNCSFRSNGTEVIPDDGWRFAPACCAAHPVIQRGPCCAVPRHRLPWAAQVAPQQQTSRTNRFGRSGENTQGCSGESSNKYQCTAA